jgi:gamma-glutamyl:cysteine ligase YbdK (ATP-grasp superfamily)
MSRKFKLFEVYGVELEYMIVDKTTLKAKPIADELIKMVTGDYTSDVERGPIAWSNELVSHVVELKTNGPVKDMAGLDALFMENVKEIQGLLAQHGAMLMPTAVHPFFDPMTETQIWPHEYNEVYSLYNRMFDCKGHGWSNLQSTHINLPFNGDEEFGKLHAAIRVLLPIIPCLSASSPILDGEVSAWKDARLEAYRHNQESIPEIAGHIVPEAVFTQADYQEKIFSPIMAKVRPYDTDKVLDKHFVNSRGAIARFDRGAIEIRIIDIQECPKADIAILQAIVAVLKALVNETWCLAEEQRSWNEKDLKDLLLDHIQFADDTVIRDSAYLKLFGIQADEMSTKDLWKHLMKACSIQDDTLDLILSEGCLSSRILSALKGSTERKEMETIFHELSACLNENRLFRS